MIKQKIQSRFDAASTSYNEVAHVQKESAHILITKLQNAVPEFYPKTTLDLGTGTGYIPEKLLPYYSNSFFMLNDIASNMIKIVQARFNCYKTFTFRISDMEYDNFKNQDLIISNFALQWVNQLEYTLKKFYIKSKVFAFSCLVDGTFDEWNHLIKRYGSPQTTKQYPTKKNLINFLSALGSHHHHFDVKTFHLSFKNIRCFMEYLKKLGATASHRQLPLEKIKYILKNHKEEFSITYKVFFGIMARL